MKIIAIVDLDEIIMTHDELNELMIKYYRLNDEQSKELKLRFKSKLRDWIINHPTEIEYYLGEVQAMISMEVLQVFVEHRPLTLKNVGPLNCAWMTELKNYTKELEDSGITIT